MRFSDLKCHCVFLLLIPWYSAISSWLLRQALGFSRPVYSFWTTKLIYYAGEFHAFATDCFYGVWCHGLITCHLYVSPLLGNLVWSDNGCASFEFIDVVLTLFVVKSSCVEKYDIHIYIIKTYRNRKLWFALSWIVHVITWWIISIIKQLKNLNYGWYHVSSMYTLYTALSVVTRYAKPWLNDSA